MTPKSLRGVGTTSADIQSLPPEAQRQLGFDLRAVQLGQMPRDWKPMASIGSGVAEIRVRAGGAFRLIYVAQFAQAVYVLHVSQKKSQQTSPLDLALAHACCAALRRRGRRVGFMAIRIQRSSGNVFSGMGFPREEAAHLLIRTDLMIQLTGLIAEHGLTQKQAAKALCVTQPRISDLVRGRIELFSIDTLLDILSRLGVAVTLKTKRRSRVA